MTPSAKTSKGVNWKIFRGQTNFGLRGHPRLGFPQAIKRKRFRFSVHFPRLHTLFPTLPNNNFSDKQNRDLVVAVDYCDAKLSQSHTTIQIFRSHGTILPRSASKWHDSAKLQFDPFRIQIFRPHRHILPSIAQKWRGFDAKIHSHYSQIQIPRQYRTTWPLTAPHSR